MKNRVINDVISHSGKHTHPRVILTKTDFKRIRESDDPIYVMGRKHVVEEAESFMDKPLLEYDIPDGIRLLAVSRAILTRTKNLAMAYQITGDKRYAERLYRELANAASYKDWNPYHFLDVGEMCCAFGIGYDWIYDYMSKEERKVLRTAMVEKGFLAVMDDYLDRERRRSYRWYQDDPGDNWKFVCNGGISVAALAVCDEEDIDKEWLSDIFGYAFENTHRAVREMYLPDGSYAEGFTYWNYATDYLAYYVSALKSATGTDYGLSDYEPLRTSAYYVRLMCANSFRAFNFGDAWEFFACAEVFSWVGKNFGDDKITTMRADEIRKDPSIIRVRDLFWYVPTEPVGLDGMPVGFGSVGGSNASFRNGFKEDDFYAAIHFGDNNAYHAHADTGTFVVEWNKKRFLCDLGQDNYNVKGDYRFTYRYRAEGHNTLIINPSEEHDQERMSSCMIDRFSSGECGEGYAVCDISDAYFGKKVVRGMRITEDRNWITVRDEMTLDSTDTGYWFAHTKANATISEDGKSATLEIDGDRIYLEILEGGKFILMPAKHLYKGHDMPDQFDNSEYKKLAISFVGSTNIEVAVSPMVNGKKPACVPAPKKLCEW